MMKMVVTPCAKNKNLGTHKALDLYKSTRIKAVYNKIKNTGALFAVLSSKYGLVFENEEVEAYELKMNSETMKRLIPKVSSQLKNLNVDELIFFPNWGLNNPYIRCIVEACKSSKTKLTLCGYNVLGGINELPNILSIVRSK
jgi:hypothetical protein